ncbi:MULTISPECIES: hypothetical protein [Streptomyces]|uniref:hypothetical protein n=1 Tax=Streptomyces TaxID=1883 RepID=UPI001925D2E8|nr:hypothetical protein [Streptomyces sp. SID685]
MKTERGREAAYDGRGTEWATATGPTAESATAVGLVVVCDQDRSALPAPALRAAGEAPAAEVVHLTGRHYAPFLESHEQAVAAELSFLEEHLAPRVP